MHVHKHKGNIKRYNSSTTSSTTFYKLIKTLFVIIGNTTIEVSKFTLFG